MLPGAARGRRKQAFSKRQAVALLPIALRCARRFTVYLGCARHAMRMRTSLPRYLHHIAHGATCICRPYLASVFWHLRSSAVPQQPATVKAFPPPPRNFENKTHRHCLPYRHAAPPEAASFSAKREGGRLPTMPTASFRNTAFAHAADGRRRFPTTQAVCETPKQKFLYRARLSRAAALAR